MPQLRISLFGSPTFVLDGQQVMLDRWKAVALLAHLALEDRPQRRDGLATLLWPEHNQAQARNGLRRTLNALKHTLGDHWLRVSRETLQINRNANLWVDVWRFRELLTPRADAVAPTEQALQEAIALYRDDLLSGFSLRDASAFEDWRYFAAEDLRGAMSGALAALLNLHIAHGERIAALSTARRWLALDPLQEDVHRTLIELHLANGDRAAAQRQYEHCAQLLAQELGVEPAADLRALLAASPVSSAPSALARPQPPYREPDEGSLTAQSQDEARQVVVLNLALAGWPEGAHRRDQQHKASQLLAAVSATVQSYAGYIDHLGADGATAIFGLTHIHEDDAERAVHVAATLLRTARMTGVQIAAGVKIGSVLTTYGEQDDAANMPRPFGAVLGQAAELQVAAAADQVLVDRATYLRTLGAFDYRETSVMLRSQAGMSAAYALQTEVQLQKTRGIPGLQSRLIGRDAELAAMENALHELVTGVGQVLLLVGEAGIGKSRLVAEMRARRSAHCLWLEGRCLEMTRPASYWPFLDALHDYFGWRSDEDDATRAASILAGLNRLCASQLLDEDACAEIGAVLGRLFDVRFGNGWDQRLANATPPELRHRTVAALRTLLIAVARLHPLALVLEDLHWADDSSLDLINELLPFVEREPLLLLCVYRPMPDQRCSQLPLLAARRCPGRWQELDLRDLTADQTRQMVESLLEIEALAPATNAWILERAQGNPYFTEEVILALIEAGLIRRDADVWRTSVQATGALSAVELPYSLDQLILTRVDRLAAPLRRTLEAAAVLGRTFLLPLLHELAPQPNNLASMIAELEERSFLYCEQAEPVGEFSFRHVLTQEAIYQMLTDERRSALHQRAGQAIERLLADALDAQTDTLAFHYARSEDHRRAVTYLMKAGVKARQAFANDVALTYFHQALDHLQRVVDQDAHSSAAIRCEAWNQIGRCNYALGRYALAEQAFRQAIADAQVADLLPQPIVRLIYWLGEALYWQDKQHEMVDAAQAGLALLPAGEPCSEQVLMLGHWAAASWALGDPQQYCVCVQRIIPIIRDFPLTEELSPAYHHVNDLYKYRKDVATALAWTDLLHRAAAERQDMTTLTKALFTRGITQSEQGDYVGAHALLEEALKMSLRVGETTFQYFCLRRLAINALVVGDLDEAFRIAERLPQLPSETGAFSRDVNAFCGLIYLSAGRIEDALDLLGGDCTPASAQQSEQAPEWQLWLGCALAAAGNTQQAERTLRALLDICSPDRVYLKAYPDQKPIFWRAVVAVSRLLDDPQPFAALCDHLHSRWPHTEVSGSRILSAVLAEPTLMEGVPSRRIDVGELAEWQWVDPFSDSLLCIDQGVEIAAADGRDLWHINLGAPTLRVPVEGDFALQARCRPSLLRPLAMGGLLLWHAATDFVRLDWGGLAAGEIGCLGCLGKTERVWGRGHSACAQIFLRLERVSERVRALFSEDGERWLLVGEVMLEAVGPWQIGFFALGAVDRTFCPAAPAGGGALQFDDIQLCRGASAYGLPD